MGRIRAHPYRDGLCLIQGERQQEKTKVALFEVYILPLQEKKTHCLIEIMSIETHACRAALTTQLKVHNKLGGRFY